VNPSPLRVFIADDEAPARQRLRTLLADVAGEVPNHVVGEAENGIVALAAFEGLSADVALVDIRMPRMDGLELARHLACLPVPPAVIFTTAYDQHAVQAFELNAVDYLLKPIRAARLQQALEKVGGAGRAAEGGGHGDGSSRGDFLQKLDAVQDAPRRFLSCHERGRLLLVPADEVLYFRADTKYVTARTIEREYLLDESLLHLESEFSERFIRLHRNALAAKDALAGFEKTHDAEGEHWLAMLRGIPEKLPVSRRQWTLVKEFAKRLSG
jgi:two-component system, LytTR family, response regulator AlgR